MAEYHGNESPQDGLAELSSPPADQAADREHQPEVSTARDTADEFDTLVALLRQPAPLASFSQEPGCDRAVEAIRQMGHTPNPSDFAPMASADGQSQPLQTLGQYQLLEKLGEGGMGAVYRAVHTRLEKVVAVKVMSPGRVADTDAVARFSREMKAVGKLNHPNIVGAFDAGEIDGSHYLVMELVDGQDLGAIVRGTGPLPVADACEAVRRAAAGLDHAHAHGLVHRDVKPSNLMLTRQGEIKLLDLGLARLAEQIPGGVELTSTGQMMGTFEYMAPEQGSDSHAVDHRADVYALGATLYKLLAGRAPFAGPQYDTPMKRMMALATEDPEPIRQIRPDVPKDLARVIHRMLARDPGQRTATAREAAERLAPFAAGADLAGLVARADEAAPQPSVEPGTASTQPAASSAMEHTPHTIRISPPAAFRPRAGRLRRVGAWFGNLPPIGRFGLAAAAGAAALILLAVLLTVKTPQGTLVIESDDPSVEVLVKQNGEVIDILSADHGWKVGLKDGKYEVELAGGADRMQLSDNQVTLTRSGRTVLRVTRDVVAADLSVEPTAAPFPAEGTAEDQKAWVVAELKRLNPESTANIGFSVGGNNVTGMKIDDGNIHDLRPLAELTSLQKLECSFGGDDLSPLAGLPLETIFLRGAKITDISPLENAPLKSVNLQYTNVQDLTPLAGKPLEFLDVYGKQRDFSVLKGMPLKNLNIGSTGLKDLTLLEGMPLETLCILGTPVDDLSPLRGMKLRELLCHSTRVRDLGPLEGMPLESLDMRGLKVTDLSPLRGTALSRLDMENALVSDLSPLAATPLRNLNCRGTAVKDFTPLVDTPLLSITCDFRPEDAPVLRRIRTLNTINNRPAGEVLRDAEDKVRNLEDNETPTEPARPFPEQGSVDEQKAWVVAELKRLNAGFQGDPRFGVEEGKIVSLSLGDQWKLVDISPLKDLPLKRYDCWNNGVSDLSPLRGMPLEFINTSGTQVHDLTPLAGMQLKVLQITDTKVVDLSPLAETTVEEIKCNFVPERDGEGLRQITTLKTINSRPAAEVLRAAEEKLKDSEDSETPDVVEPGK